MASDHAALGLGAQEAYLVMARDLADARMEVDGLRGEVAALGEQLRRSRMERVLAALSVQSIVIASTASGEGPARRRRGPIGSGGGSSASPSRMSPPTSGFSMSR